MKTDEQHAENKVELGFLEALQRRLPDNDEVLKALGDLYTETGMIKEGLAADLHLTERCPSDPNVWYNLACSYALDKQISLAFQALHTAVDHGYCDVEWLLNDDDLEALRIDQRFVELIERLANQ